MKRFASVLSFVVLFAGIMACDLFSTSTSTGIVLATAVAGTLTAQAQQAAAVASTVAALAPSTPTPYVQPTAVPIVPPPVVTPPVDISPVVPPPVVVPPVAPPPATYSNLVVRYSQNCLGVQGNQAVEATCSPSTQLWDLPAGTSVGYFQIVLQNSGSCLSASSTHETDPYILKPCGGSDDQLWLKRPSGGYFQLANKTQLAEDSANMCIDARQWDQPFMQWPCKPWGTDDQLDNQLFCQTTATTTAACAPPPGVYVTRIVKETQIDPDKPATSHVYFRVTFDNTTGAATVYPWFVRAIGKDGGQTPQQALAIRPGVNEIRVGPWNIGRTSEVFTAKVFWIRPSDSLQFTFKNPNGTEATLQFQLP
jgi:hypothetical protein